uniref:Transcription initiation factor IIA gamma chain n=1 Tax=Naja naja TaxID=35670 RepID=A0A8C6Y315_NAJNA
MTYQLYRKTTLGNSLQKSLDDPIQSQQITPQLSLQVVKMDKVKIVACDGKKTGSNAAE